MIKEDKISLIHRRAELVTVLAGPPTEDRVRIQGELSVINAKIKALNTTQHAQLKALADQRKAAGLAEAQANAARAQTRAHLLPQTKPLEDSDDAADQVSVIDAWIDAVLLRHDIEFTRSSTGKITFGCSPDWIPVLEMLFAGIEALARGQQLPELPSEAPRRPKKTAKSKKQ